MVKEKSFNLISDYQDGWAWCIRAIVLPNGTFHKKGIVIIQNTKEHNRRYRELHKKETFEYAKRYRELHREEMCQNYKHWVKNNRQRRTEINKKHIHKRHREFGFKKLNLWFLSRVAHHVDREQVIYIPEELHRGISHNMFTGKGIFEINLNAWEFLKNEYGVRC